MGDEPEPRLKGPEFLKKRKTRSEGGSGDEDSDDNETLNKRGGSPGTGAGPDQDSVASKRPRNEEGTVMRNKEEESRENEALAGSEIVKKEATEAPAATANDGGDEEKVETELVADGHAVNGDEASMLAEQDEVQANVLEEPSTEQAVDGQQGAELAAEKSVPEQADRFADITGLDGYLLEKFKRQVMGMTYALRKKSLAANRKKDKTASAATGNGAPETQAGANTGSTGKKQVEQSTQEPPSTRRELSKRTK
ncbi:hypothetical protein FVE85_2117 [Porphyridium purpureum]|uniref:Uncharacterized protein n=1 Tax=Porphyridium purpureum TaxID=35688 RepID=A0A5J4YYK2_PORPP|nr:hypothetical protein FVE85_2117 [Porphyridium purpureum]|eukprot:POR3779..scf209_3